MMIVLAASNEVIKHENQQLRALLERMYGGQQRGGNDYRANKENSRQKHAINRNARTKGGTLRRNHEHN